GAESLPGRDIFSWIFVLRVVGIFPQLYALYLTSRMLYSTMAGISNQFPTSSGTKRKPKLWGKI
ncbi:hypothetical protein, partial [Salmonella enterica]|uniref:hypothetical protein n=1 Tax=Salmonella enterica TaxID=28901 RepID=UPI003297144A